MRISRALLHKHLVCASKSAVTASGSKHALAVTGMRTYRNACHVRVIDPATATDDKSIKPTTPPDAVLLASAPAQSLPRTNPLQVHAGSREMAIVDFAKQYSRLSICYVYPAIPVPVDEAMHASAPTASTIRPKSSRTKCNCAAPSATAAAATVNSATATVNSATATAAAATAAAAAATTTTTSIAPRAYHPWLQHTLLFSSSALRGGPPSSPTWCLNSQRVLRWGMRSQVVVALAQRRGL
eukprot:1120338-Pleurochrysis_carterae.AAC.1